MAYLDSSLADLRFVRGWILLMTRVIMVDSDRLFYLYFHGSYKIYKERLIAILSCQHQIKDSGISKPFPMESWPNDKPLHSAKVNGISSLFLSD